jgi:hypothetical protein
LRRLVVIDAAVRTMIWDFKLCSFGRAYGTSSCLLLLVIDTTAVLDLATMIWDSSCVLLVVVYTSSR